MVAKGTHCGGARGAARQEFLRGRRVAEKLLVYVKGCKLRTPHQNTTPK